MYLPEYAITNQTLRNIGGIEYSKALIETTTILQNWQSKLESEAKTRFITYTLQGDGLNTDVENVKRYVSKLPATVNTEIKSCFSSLELIYEMAQTKAFDENDIKELYYVLSKRKNYRQKVMEHSINPDEILASMTELLDWSNSLDAKETHPLVVAAILKARIEQIKPFEDLNNTMADLTTKLYLKSNGYSIKDYFSVEEHFIKSQQHYQKYLLDALEQEDYTKWIEYYTDAYNRELSNIAENVKILLKDTKISKAAGKTRLSERQEKIVTYLQDYGLMQNKDFPKLFPNISEDTVLRELKSLMSKGIVVKRGKTKSSRYELS